MVMSPFSICVMSGCTSLAAVVGIVVVFVAMFSPVDRSLGAVVVAVAMTTQWYITVMIAAKKQQPGLISEKETA